MVKNKINSGSVATRQMPNHGTYHHTRHTHTPSHDMTRSPSHDPIQAYNRLGISSFDDQLAPVFTSVSTSAEPTGWQPNGNYHWVAKYLATQW